MAEVRELASGLKFPEGPVAMADGSVRVVYKNGPSEATLRAAITRNGGDTLGPDW